jgi:hypothetical protein
MAGPFMANDPSRRKKRLEWRNRFALSRSLVVCVASRGTKTKRMNWRHSSHYGNDEQRSDAEKDVVSYLDICDADH